MRVPLTGGVGARPEETYEANPGYTPSPATLARGRSCLQVFVWKLPLLRSARRRNCSITQR